MTQLARTSGDGGAMPALRYPVLMAVDVGLLPKMCVLHLKILRLCEACGPTS